MGFFLPQAPIRGSLVDTFGAYSSWSIRTKLIATIIPLVAIVMLACGFATRLVAGRYLSLALERTTMVLTMGQAHALTLQFEQARQDILLLAKSAPSEEVIRTFLTTQSHLLPGFYREVAFVSATSGNHLLFLDSGRDVVRVSPDQAERIKETPLLLPSRLSETRGGEVSLFGMAETTYPLGVLPGTGAGLTLPVLRLVTSAHDASGQLTGFWVLSVDGRSLRDVLSLYNSAKSPLAAFLRTAEKRYSFFFDMQGWLLFQSGNIEEKNRPLSNDLARSGLSGDHGMPAYPGAFRPAAGNEAYWRMVADVQSGRTGLEIVDSDLEFLQGGRDQYSLGYAPVYFQPSLNREPEVIGGVAFMDKSRLMTTAEYRIYDVLMIIVACGAGLAGLVIWLVSRSITKPILALARAIGELPAKPAQERTGLEVEVKDKESRILKESINGLILAVNAQQVQLRERDARITSQLRRLPVDLEARKSETGEDEPMEGVIGASPAMRELKWLIQKAAKVDPDVLIIGETGTGKEVTAQAVHRLSARAAGPFLSINCGALDENLLLDALFGHVRGAFSDAKTDRKGAFLAAEGGTILLDEIGNASAKVQQALLRTLATRTVIPLGSDKETAFNVRVIAATNVDLLECVENGAFREDLYYRLRVLTLHTPPLRDRKEDIPLLSDAFLKESARVMNKGVVTLSQGAWERLNAHDWPGNVRELKHCLMRAVAMAESDVIYLEDLRFDAQGVLVPVLETPELASAQARPQGRGEPARSAPTSGLASKGGHGHGVNERQFKALAYLREHGVLTRSRYQELLGSAIPPRTAQYDLRDLVKRGLIRVSGRGPATKYLLHDKDASAP